MKTILKKIYTILTLITNVLVRRKHYTLRFFAEQIPPQYLDAPHLNAPKRWYYNFKHWGFSKDNLEMVAGADHLCNYYANGNFELTIDIVASKKPLKNEDGYDKFEAEQLPKQATLKDKLIYGRSYYKFENEGKKITTMWICPVTLFVLGRYPNYIYIKKK